MEYNSCNIKYQGTDMIQITTTEPDAMGNLPQDAKQIAPGIVYSETDGTIIISDREQSIQVRISE